MAPKSWKFRQALLFIKSEISERPSSLLCKPLVVIKSTILHQSPPRYTDSLTSIAQICEIQGDYSGAIDAIREEIRLLAEDWNTTTGETVDQHLRKIELLERKLMLEEGRGA